MITVTCPKDDPNPVRPVPGCGHVFDVETDTCDDMVDCPSCGLFFDPGHPNSQPQTAEARAGWAVHMASYESVTRSDP